MDHENAIAEEKLNSLSQLDQMFYNKIVGRESFKGNSMRMFYTENAAAVPFEWERQPGTPKHPQTETIPPIKPPPAAHSQSLEKPSFPSSHATMTCFWRRRRSNKKGRKANKGHRERGASDGGNSPESIESADVNGDLNKPSSDHSRSSSSSSSFSTSSSSSSSSLRSLAKGLWVKLSL